MYRLGERQFAAGRRPNRSNPRHGGTNPCRYMEQWHKDSAANDFGKHLANVD